MSKQTKQLPIRLPLTHNILALNPRRKAKRLRRWNLTIKSWLANSVNIKRLRRMSKRLPMSMPRWRLRMIAWSSSTLMFSPKTRSKRHKFKIWYRHHAIKRLRWRHCYRNVIARLTNCMPSGWTSTRESTSLMIGTSKSKSCNRDWLRKERKLKRLYSKNQRWLSWRVTFRRTWTYSRKSWSISKLCSSSYMIKLQAPRTLLSSSILKGRLRLSILSRLKLGAPWKLRTNAIWRGILTISSRDYPHLSLKGDVALWLLPNNSLACWKLSTKSELPTTLRVKL